MEALIDSELCLWQSNSFWMFFSFSSRSLPAWIDFWSSSWHLEASCVFRWKLSLDSSIRALAFFRSEDTELTWFRRVMISNSFSAKIDLSVTTEVVEVEEALLASTNSASLFFSVSSRCWQRDLRSLKREKN